MGTKTKLRLWYANSPNSQIESFPHFLFCFARDSKAVKASSPGITFLSEVAVWVNRGRPDLR